MSTIKEKMYFNFDGIWSNDFNLISVQLDGGMFEESLVASRSIEETKVTRSDKTLFNRVESSPLEFEMIVAFTEDFTDQDLDNVIDWLIQDRYKPIYFEGKQDKIYYCMAEGDAKIHHNGFGQGYIILNMRCNSPYVYSPIIVTDAYDLSIENKMQMDIEILNEGFDYLYPEISIEMKDAGDVLIKNITYFGEEFEVNDLTKNEEIYINSEKRIITSDMASLGVHRYDNVAGDYLRLPKGRNLLQIKGNCIIQFRYQFKYRF